LESAAGGGFDSLADESGISVLSRVQDALRHTEASTNATILNALAEHICLLDQEGKIIAVNQAWRQYAHTNLLADPQHGLGMNYLAVCDSARGDGAAGAADMAAGIRTVLNGSTRDFCFEYPCHSPNEEQWFLLNVAPLATDRSGGAVVMHTNISERKRTETKSQRFSAAMDAVADAIYMVDRPSMRFVHINDAACRMQGRTREDLFALGPASVFGMSGAALEREYDAVIASGANTAPLEMDQCREDGTQVWIELRRHAQLSNKRWIIVTLVRDITERKEAEKQLHLLAHYDDLTGLPNRSMFAKTLQKTLAMAGVVGWQVVVMIIDIDNFKNINDTLGHAIGDQLLCEFTRRITRSLRMRDTVGRLGGDEFALILAMEDSLQGTPVVARKVRDALREPFALDDLEVAVTVSIGITMHPNDAGDAEHLLRSADTAMHQAKKAGRDTYRFFTAQMNADALARLDLESALRKALENNEFLLAYQPKVDIRSGRIVGVEALIRWQRPGHGTISPLDFIPLLEESGLIVPVGAWVIDTACRQIAAWQQARVTPVQISVNVSGRQFAQGGLDTVVVDAIVKHGIAPGFLELELTESSLMTNAEDSITSLNNLKALGIQISIDDFGTGYSSLAYLKRFPIDKLKIDIAFIADITSNPEDAAITLAIISMAHSLKLQVIAEGVETAEQLAYLRLHGCDQMQGYYFSRPVPPAELQKLLKNASRLPDPAA
jgi:diguanylate cyclase (GGDEF)-like protein/PAS domain S-box-containing protein